MVSVCTVPVRGGRSCEHFGGYKTLNRIPLTVKHTSEWEKNVSSTPQGLRQAGEQNIDHPHG